MIVDGYGDALDYRDDVRIKRDLGAGTIYQV
jgi:hypothetical protein